MCAPFLKYLESGSNILMSMSFCLQGGMEGHVHDAEPKSWSTVQGNIVLFLQFPLALARLAPTTAGESFLVTPSNVHVTSCFIVSMSFGL